MADVQLYDPRTGTVYDVDEAEAEDAARTNRLVPATPEHIAAYDAQQRSGGIVDTLATVPQTAAAAVMDTTQGILQSTLYPDLRRPSNEALARVAAESGDPLDPFSAKAQERREVNPGAAIAGGLAADVTVGAVVPGGLVGRAIATGLVSEGAETTIRGDEYSMTDAGLYGLIGGGIEAAGTLALGAAMRAAGRTRNALDATVERARRKGVRSALDAAPGPEQAAQYRRHADDLYDHFDEELSAALSEVDETLAATPDRLFSPEALRRTVAPNARAQADQTLDLAAQLDQAAQVTGNPRMREAATILETELEGSGAAQFAALRAARNQLVDVAEESPLIREAIEALDGSLGNEGIWGKAARNYTSAASGTAGEPVEAFTARELGGREALDQKLERAREVAQATGNEQLERAVKRAEDALDGADKVTGAKVMGGPGDADEIETLRKKVADFETRSAALADETRASLEALDKRIDGDLTDLSNSYRRVAKIVARDEASVAKQMAWGGQVADGADALRGRLGTPRPSAVTRESTESAYSLEGKTLEDLGHRGTQAEKLEAVRGDAKFRRGRVEGDEEGISLIDDPQLGLRMNDGRHRFAVAKERGERSIYGTVRDPESGEILFRGDIPLEGAPAGSRRRVVEYATATDPAIAELLSLPGIKTHASKLDSTLAAMSQSVRQAKNTEQLFKAIYQGKQALQKLVKGMGQALSQTSGLAERQGIEALQAMAEEYQNSVLQGLYRREVWGDAAEFMAGINRALHEKVIPASAAVAQDFERFLGREYLTNKPISTWAPEKIRAHFSARMKGSTTADEQLKRWLSGAEDAIATHRKWGTADPRELARAEADIVKIRKALAEVDEIPVAQRRVRDFDAQPQSLVDKLMAKGGARLASKVIGGAAGFVAGGPVGAIAGGLAGEAFEPIVESALKTRGRAVAARVKTGLQKLVERERAPLGAVLRDETAQATISGPSPGAQRIRDIMARRKGQSGGVDVGRAPGANPKLLTEVRQKLANWDKQEAAYREALARKDALDIEMNRAGIRRMEADTESARKAAAKEERALRAKIDKLDDELEDLSSNRTEKWDSNWDEPLEQLRHAMEEAGDPRAAKLAELEDLGDASAVRAAMDDLDRGGRVGDVIARRRGQGGAVLFEDEDTFERVLRRDPNTPELKDRFAEADDSGITKRLSEEDLEKMVGVGVLPHEGWPEVTSTQNWVRVRVEDPFEFDRWIVREPNGELVARHAVLRLPSDLRGAGVAKRYLADAVETYEKLGIKEIQIPKATEDGVVVWFKLGAVESPGGLILKTAKESGFEVESLEQLAKTRRGQSFLMDLEQKEPGMFGDFILDVANLKSRLGRMSPDQLVSQAGNVRTGPDIRDILTSPIGLTSGVGAAALAAPVAYNELKSLGFDEDESAALGFLDEQGLTIDQIDEMLDPEKLAERAERRFGMHAVRQKLGYLATQARTAITTVARYLASPTATPRQIPRIPNVTSSAGVQSFLGSHETLREAYEDKRAVLKRLESDPMVLVDELTSSLDELAETAPELHAQMVAQTYRVAQFLQSKLPATIGASLTRPDGLPPNMLAVRQFALYYSAATDPSSVLEDLANNRARREQVDTLRELWPDTYQAVKTAVLGEMAKARPRVTQRIRLDLLMDFGDALDTGLSWRLASLAQEQAQQQQKQPTRAPERRTQPSIRNTNATAALSGALA